MKNPRRVLPILLLAILLAATSAGAAKVTLTVMGAFPNTTPYGQLLYKYVDEYQQLHPDVKIVQLPRTGGDQDEMEKIYTAVAAGVAPDIVMVPQIFLTDYVAKGVVAPVPQDLVQKARDAYLPAALFLGRYRNVLYGFPTEAQSQALAYNTAVFEKFGVADAPPKTWDELADMARKMTKSNGDGSPDQIGFGGPKFQTLSASWFLSFARSNGGDPLPLDLSYVNFSMPESIEAAEFMTRLMNENHAAIQGTGGFGDGKVAMYLAPGSWHAYRWRQVGMDFYEGLRSAPLPAGSTGNSESTFYGYLWAVTPQTKQAKAAYDFLFWLCTEVTDRDTTRMGDVLEAQGNIPNTPWDAQNQPSVREPYMKGFLDVVMTGVAKPIPPVPSWMESFGELHNQATRIFNGEVSAKEGLGLVDQFIQKKLDEAFESK